MSHDWLRYKQCCTFLFCCRNISLFTCHLLSAAYNNPDKGYLFLTQENNLNTFTFVTFLSTAQRDAFSTLSTPGHCGLRWPRSCAPKCHICPFPHHHIRTGGVVQNIRRHCKFRQNTQRKWGKSTDGSDKHSPTYITQVKGWLPQHYLY